MYGATAIDISPRMLESEWQGRGFEIGERVRAKSRFCLDWISPNIAHVREMFSVILIVEL